MNWKLPRFTQVLIIIILHTIAVSFLNAQSDFRPGYIQLNEHDTVYGFIDYKNDNINVVECHFKKTKNEKVQILKANKIFGYRFLEGKFYISKKVETKNGTDTIFLEYLVKGSLNLFYYCDIYGCHYLLQKTDSPIKEISYRDETIYKDGKAFRRNSLINQPLLRYYMRDCPELSDRIGNFKVPNHKILIDLVKQYNEITCPKSICTIYEKKIPKQRLEFQPVFGFLKYSFGDDMTYFKSNFSVYYGILTYIWLPLENEKIFFKTGFIYSKVDGIFTFDPKIITPIKIDTSYDIIKIPIQIHIENTMKRVSPSISPGVSLYFLNRSFSVLFSLDAGLNIRLNKRLSFSVNASMDLLRSKTNCFYLGLKYRL